MVSCLQGSPDSKFDSVLHQGGTIAIEVRNTELSLANGNAKSDWHESHTRWITPVKDQHDLYQSGLVQYFSKRSYTRTRIADLFIGKHGTQQPNQLGKKTRWRHETYHWDATLTINRTFPLYWLRSTSFLLESCSSISTYETDAHKIIYFQKQRGNMQYNNVLELTLTVNSCTLFVDWAPIVWSLMISRTVQRGILCRGDDEANEENDACLGSNEQETLLRESCTDGMSGYIARTNRLTPCVLAEKLTRGRFLTARKFDQGSHPTHPVPHHQF